MPCRNKCHAVVFDGRAPQRVVMIEFPTLADAERWRSSPEFQKLKPLQQQSSKYIESFAIEGVTANERE
jgi:uncharacterized protein (DUF1330 family)